MSDYQQPDWQITALREELRRAEKRIDRMEAEKRQEFRDRCFAISIVIIVINASIAITILADIITTHY